MITQREIYLDANATHPYLKGVREGLAAALVNKSSFLSNPSSIHRRGQSAKAMVARFRQTFCEYLGRPDGDEFVICSGATEALNAAMRGFVRNRQSKNRNPVLIVTTIEHKAVLDTAADLEAQGIDVFTLPVDVYGQISENDFLKILDRVFTDANTDVLCTFQVVNNEIGTAYDLSSLFNAALKKYGQTPQPHLPRIKGGRMQLTAQRLFLCLDAVQALGKLEDSYLRSCMHYADYAAFSGHKIGAPTGIGALWMRPSAPFESFITGGPQERKRRAGTLNALGIYGFQLALEDWAKNGAAYRAKFKKQRAHLLKEMSQIEGLKIHAVPQNPEAVVLENTINFHVEGCLEESLLLSLDLDGFSLASGSACNSGSLKPSYVLMALGFGEEVGVSSVRISLGVESSDEEIEEFLKSLKHKIVQIRTSREQAREIFGEESFPLNSLEGNASIRQPKDSNL
jgi:cysteine desulfurase